MHDETSTLTAASSAELRLAIACCRHPHDDGAAAAVAAAAACVADWPAFEAIVLEHRIAGHAAAALPMMGAALPAPVRARIAAAARAAAANDLLLAAETARLQACFDGAAMPALFLKGAPVGVLAYGRLGVKQSWDIDLLTTPDCLDAAIALLEREGYALAHPAGMTRAALHRFARYTNEAQLRDRRGLTVELHWRLFSKPWILAGVTARSECQLVPIAGRPVRTFANDLLVPYLIAHGQEHGWSRLKWLADLSALLAGRDEAEFAALLRRGEDLGLASATAAALILCEQLLGLPLPSSVARAVHQRHGINALVRANMACIADPEGGSDVPTLAAPPWKMRISYFRSEASWRLLGGELRTLWTRPPTRARYPAALDFVYHLLRIPLFLLGLPPKLRALRRYREVPDRAVAAQCSRNDDQKLPSSGSSA